MLNRIYIFLIALLAVSCGQTPEPEYIPKPVIDISFGSFSGSGLVVKVSSLNVDEVYAIACSPADSAPAPDHIVEEGLKAVDGQILIQGLERGSEYIIYGVGKAQDAFSSISSFSVTIPLLYDDEVERDGIPDFADLDLLPGGRLSKTPNTWSETRLLPHVTFTDAGGRERWLHEAFLFIGSEDSVRKRIFCIAEGKNHSGDQESWADFANYWLGESGVIKTLDRTIGNGIARIGKPGFRHKVVMTMPDPIMLEYFYDKTSSTKYWGSAYGRQLDFSDANDQVLAYMWFIDYVRELWDKAAPANVDLAGFYILSEILVAKPDGWNYQYKRWDKILPSVSEYLHGMNYGLYWIPYYQADGYDMTDKLGIDYTWIQPNKYWDYPEKKQKKDWGWVTRTMNSYGHGMELEFEGSHGEAGWSQYESGVPRTNASILETILTDNDAEGRKKGTPNVHAERNKALFREYMNEFKKAGFYGKARIATYSGTNAMYELGTSTDPKDREMYLEYCEFIVNSPLRK